MNRFEGSNTVENNRKKCIAIKTVWKTKVEKPADIEEFYTTATLAIEILDRLTKHIEECGEMHDIGAELSQLQNTLDQYKAYLFDLVRGKKLNRHLENSVRRTKLVRFNAQLHYDVASVLEVRPLVLY